MATIKQLTAIKNVVGNGGNVTKAMIDAGYSPETANTPQKLTESKVFKQLMKEKIPDDYLLGKHRQFLDSDEHETVAIRALDMAYKLKGKYAPVKGALAVGIGNLIDEAEAPPAPGNDEAEDNVESQE